MKRDDFRNYYGQLEKFETYLKERRFEPININMTLEFKDVDGESTTPNFEDIGYEKITCPHHYGKFNSYHNFRIKMHVTGETTQYKLYGLFNMGYEQESQIVGAETIMYKDGVPYSGVDLNHREIPLGKLNGMFALTLEYGQELYQKIAYLTITKLVATL